MTRIHPTAVVANGASVHSTAIVGAYSVVLDQVEIARNAWIASHVVISTPPEHRAHHSGGAPAAGLGVRVGEDVVVHEFVSIQSGIFRRTSLGPGSFLMAKANIGHDVVLGEGVTVATGVSIGGECTVGRFANIGLGATVHQGVEIGDYAMVGMGAAVVRDVPPFATLLGGVARQVGVNRVGAERAGLSGDWLDQYDRLLAGELPLGLVPEEVTAIFERWQARAHNA